MAYNKEWHQNHKEELKAKRAIRQSEVQTWLDDYRATLKCELCGETHPACLDFHHLDPSLKEIGIGKAVHSSWNIQRIQSEIKKCRVLCSNCHRKLHWQEKHAGLG